MGGKAGDEGERPVDPKVHAPGEPGRAKGFQKMVVWRAKPERMTVWIDGDEAEMLRQICAATGYTHSGFIRHSIVAMMAAMRKVVAAMEDGTAPEPDEVERADPGVFLELVKGMVERGGRPAWDRPVRAPLGGVFIPGGVERRRRKPEPPATPPPDATEAPQTPQGPSAGEGRG